ncbi:MAG: hypothetical protein M3209_14185 [Acidobacteriota bacterium]|nr:hypothetical protein [Acidobacteriota bacterium]
MQEEKESPEAEEANWEGDQKRRSYYYDDAHGYEVYNPDEDDEEENED